MVSCIALILSILFLTVLGGGIFPGTIGIVAVLLCGIACLTALGQNPRQALQPRTSTPAPSVFPWLEVIAFTALLFVLLTALPLPPALTPLTGSLRQDQNSAVVTALQEAALHGAPEPDGTMWFSLSRNRAGTLRALLLLASAFGAAFLTASMTARAKLGFLHGLALVGTSIGVAGFIAQWWSPQGDTIWWIIPIPHAATAPVGCFLNRNHFGGFVALICPVSVALAARALDRRQWVAALLHIGLAGLMIGVVFLSQSRGAILALGAGLAVTLFVIAFKHKLVWGIALSVLVVAGATGIVAKSPAVRARLAGLHDPGSLSSVQSRVAEWRETLRVWPHYPVIGAGANALRTVYPQYRQTSVSARLIHAENEYVQLLAEGGLIGVGLALALATAYWRRLRVTSDAVPPGIGIAVAGALTVAAVHCFFDFPAHLPLYALVLGGLTGVAIALPTPAGTRLRLITMLPFGLGLIAALVISFNHPYQIGTLDSANTLSSARYRDLHRALTWSPTSPAWLYLGRVMAKEGALRGDEDLFRQGERFMSRAAELDPQNYWLWSELGKTRESLKDTQGANEAFGQAHRLRSWMPAPSTTPGKP